MIHPRKIQKIFRLDIAVKRVAKFTIQKCFAEVLFSGAPWNYFKDSSLLSRKQRTHVITGLDLLGEMRRDHLREADWLWGDNC